MNSQWKITFNYYEGRKAFQINAAAVDVCIKFLAFILTQRMPVAGILRQKDLEQAQILEEKMALQQKLLAAAGVENVFESPNYCNLVTEDSDSSAMWQEVLSAVQVQ